MDAYPLDLILAVATGSATIFLGFLPTKTISCAFFARETLKASGAWAVVAFLCPLEILHYPLILAILCLCAWWHFSGNHALNGKLWLSVASGLGISVGVMLILAVTRQAYPPGMPLLNEILLLASIYLGGAVIGLAYVCLALVQGARAGVTQGVLQRYVSLLFWLVVSRITVLTFMAAHGFGTTRRYDSTLWGTPKAIHFTGNTPMVGIFLSLIFLLLPVLAFLAQRATRFSSRVQPTRLLITIICLGVVAEIVIRLPAL